jgi:hypothetical protein
LVLSPSPREHPIGGVQHSQLVIAIPWHSIKQIDVEKAAGTVTCEDGSKFMGTILTNVRDTDNREYHLSQCTKIAVKKATRPEGKEYDGPTAKCTLQFNTLAQSFTAKSVGFNSRTPDRFRMKKGNEVLEGNFSDFTKIALSSTAAVSNVVVSPPIRITAKSRQGKETEGELVIEPFEGNLVFRATNDCTVVLYLADWRDGLYARGSFAVSIER